VYAFRAALVKLARDGVPCAVCRCATAEFSSSSSSSIRAFLARRLPVRKCAPVFGSGDCPIRPKASTTPLLYRSDRFRQTLKCGRHQPTESSTRTTTACPPKLGCPSRSISAAHARRRKYELVAPQRELLPSSHPVASVDPIGLGNHIIGVTGSKKCGAGGYLFCATHAANRYGQTNLPFFLADR
jgi:hypothetical protein